MRYRVYAASPVANRLRGESEADVAAAVAHEQAGRRARELVFLSLDRARARAEACENYSC